jgi:hypothetical protein
MRSEAMEVSWAVIGSSCPLEDGNLIIWGHQLRL